MLITCESKNKGSDSEWLVRNGLNLYQSHLQRPFTFAKEHRPRFNMFVAWQDVIVSLGILGAINGALFFVVGVASRF